MENTKYVKARYLRNNIPTGPDYSFQTELDLKVGDHVELGHNGNKTVKGVVSRVDVPLEEVEPYLDRLKTISHVLEVPEITVVPNVTEETNEID